MRAPGIGMEGPSMEGLGIVGAKNGETLNKKREVSWAAPFIPRKWGWVWGEGGSPHPSKFICEMHVQICSRNFNYVFKQV